MPSLKALAEFKTKFTQISGEDQTNIALDTPFDDLPLPDHESSVVGNAVAPVAAAPPPEATVETPPLESPAQPPGDIPANAPQSAAPPPVEDPLDFGDLGDLLGGMDIGQPDSTAAVEPPPDITTPGGEPVTEPAADDFNLDLGDLGNLPDFSDIPADTGAEPPAAPASDDFNLDLGDLGDLPDFSDIPADTGAEPPVETISDQDLALDDLLAETPSLDLPVDTSSDQDLNIDDLLADAPPLDLPADASSDQDLNIDDLLADAPPLDLPADASSDQDLSIDDLLADAPPLDLPADTPADQDLDLDDLLADAPSLDLPADASSDQDLSIDDLLADAPPLDIPADTSSDQDLNLDELLADAPSLDAPADASSDQDLNLDELLADAPSLDLPADTSSDQDLNLDELLADAPSLDLPADASSDQDLNLDELLADAPSLDLPADASSDQDLNLDELLADAPSLDAPADASSDQDLNLDEMLADAPSLDAPADASSDQDLNLDELLADAPSPDLPADETLAGGDLDIPSSDDEEGFQLPGESFTQDSILPADGDSFDSFNLDNNAQPSGDQAGESLEHDLSALGDLDFLDLGSPASTQPAASGAAAQGLPGVSPAHEVEELLLSDRDVEKIQETLLSYPLNLRLTCEQIIVEEAVQPELMSDLIKSLVNKAPPRETANLAGRILGKPITIPKGYEKKTGEELEAEQASFNYIFVHSFLPVFRLFMVIALLAFSVGYLVWNFIYIPRSAEKIYKQGYDRIPAGEYNWANRRFQEAFQLHPKTEWFYRYAEAFRDERQYIEAEKKYQELMYYTASKNKRGIPDKQAVLEYADLATNYTRDFETADRLLRRNILDYTLNDYDALLALGDNSLAWAEFEPEHYEDARESYAKIIERYGQTDPVMERMLRYFILTDNLREVIPLQEYFMASEKRKISAPTLAELGGYLMDKRTQVVRGVPNEYLDYIQGIRDVLLRAVKIDEELPESHYHLSRYYGFLGNSNDEAYTLQRAIQTFDAAKEESPKRIKYHIDAFRRYAEILVNRREFFPAEENLVRGVNLYEDGLSRRVINQSPEFGRLYADLGDLEYFVKSGDMNAALDYYSRAERSGFAPPEVQYRMGAAHYQLHQWPQALNRFVEASDGLPLNRRILHALGNASYLRGNYHAAQGYFDRLLEVLETDRIRFPIIAPSDNKEQLELAERLMVTQNNLGVVLEALTDRTGDNRYRSRAMGLFSDSERAWDIITRNPLTLVRMRPSSDMNAPSINPAYLNVQNSLHPVSGYEPLFFIRIDKDMLEPSPWEELAPVEYRLSDGIRSGLD